MSLDHSRRKLLRIAGIALASTPLLIAGRNAAGATNPEIRAKLKYQDTPLGDQSCANCMAFIAGKNDKAPGKCQLIKGDDEISPNGYCSGWYTM